MAFGNFALVIALMLVAKGGSPAVVDAAVVVIVVGLVGVRYLDITRCHGTTADGKPATLAHWRRYTTLLVTVSFLFWAVARFYGSYGMNRELGRMLPVGN
jgi:hypothetical protein